MIAKKFFLLNPASDESLKAIIQKKTANKVNKASRLTDTNEVSSLLCDLRQILRAILEYEMCTRVYQHVLYTLFKASKCFNERNLPDFTGKPVLA